MSFFLEKKVSSLRKSRPWPWGWKWHLYHGWTNHGCCPSSYPICAQIGCSQHLILVEIKLHDRTRICRCCFRHHVPRLGRGARQDLQCFHNLTLWCTSTNINEIGRCTTMQLDNIHGSHGQSSLGSSCVVSRSAYIYFCLNAALSSKFNFASATTSLLSDVSARGFIYPH